MSLPEQRRACREATRELLLAQGRAWYAAHKERARAYRATVARWRSMVRKIGDARYGAPESRTPGNPATRDSRQSSGRFPAGLLL